MYNTMVKQSNSGAYRNNGKSLFGTRRRVPALRQGQEARLRRLANAAAAELSLNVSRLGPVPPFKHNVTVAMRHNTVKTPARSRGYLANIGRALKGAAINALRLGHPGVRKMRARRKAMIAAVNRNAANAKKAQRAAAVAQNNARRANVNLINAANSLASMRD